MGKVGSTGSISKTSIKKNTPVAPSSPVEEVCDKGIVVNPTPQEVLDNETYVKNTVAGLNAIDENSDYQTILAQYAAGSTITVTWYHHMNIETYARSFETDFSLELDKVHYSFLKIHNFQMKLLQALNFNYDTSIVTSTVTGEAILYPYFIPYQGDLFLYQLEANKIGLFKVSEAPERLTIKQGTCHKIKFILLAWLTEDLLDKLESCVEDEAYFDLERFLTTEGGLMTTDEQNMFNNVNKWLNLLMSWYCDNFYDKPIYRSFVEDGGAYPAKPYDPYLVEFVSRVIPFEKMPGYPTQLVSDPKQWRQSFWFKLLDPDMVPDEILISTAEILIYKVTYRTTRINALANRPYIHLDNRSDNEKIPYPFFEIPSEYDNDPTLATVPMQVRLYFDQGKVRPCYLIPLCKQIFTMERIYQFYFTPILIFLLKKVQLALKSGATNIILNDTENSNS